MEKYNQPNASPLCRRWHVLREVHDGQDGEEGDPCLLQPVRQRHQTEVGATLGAHAPVGHAHVAAVQLEGMNVQFYFIE